MAHDVFISYASKDKPVADALCATLEANGVRCWIAPRDITYGADWGEAIVDAIGASRAMVLVFSSSANVSPHIKREVDRAVSKGITVIPIRIEDVAPARALEYYISPVHWLDALTEPMERHFTALAEKVRLLVGADERDVPRPAPAVAAPRAAPAAPALQAPAPGSGRRPLGRAALVGGAVAAVAVAAALAVWQPWSPRPDPARDTRSAQQIADDAARRAMEAARADEARRREEAARVEEQRRREDAVRADAARAEQQQRRQQEAQRVAEQRRLEEARRTEGRRTDDARRAIDEAQRRAAMLQQQLEQLRQQGDGGRAAARSEAPRSDPFVIKALVEQQLRGRGLLKQGAAPWGISVDVAPGGAVTLTGIVQSGDQRSESIRVARAVPGVSAVHPQINVRDSWSPGGR